MKKLTLIPAFLFFLVFFLFGCVQNPGAKPGGEKYCVTSDDCACGTNIKTGMCFYGNKAYVNTLKQCPDFCSGFGGNLDVQCINNQCQQVNLNNVKYCDVDSDCVRKKACCDCGFGDYVNKKYQEDVVCKAECLAACATRESVGKCINHQCTAIPLTSSTDFCGTSTFGSCSTSSDCIKGGCSSQVCQSKSEEPVVTICDMRDCYNADAYNLKCECVNNKCQWR